MGVGFFAPIYIHIGSINLCRGAFTSGWKVGYKNGAKCGGTLLTIFSYISILCISLFTDCGDEYLGEWELEYEGTTYVVKVVEDEK